MSSSRNALSWITAIVLICVGVVAGVGGGILGSTLWLKKHAVAPAATPSDAQREEPRHGLPRFGPTALPSLTAQPADDTRPQSKAAQKLPGEPVLEESHEVAVAKAREVEERLLQAHSAASVDLAWAPKASEGITGVLTEVSKKAGFNVSSVDCRTNSCVATLDWKSRGEAVEKFEGAFYAWFPESCQKHMRLPDESTGDPSGGYRVRIVFDECQKSIQ